MDTILSAINVNMNTSLAINIKTDTSSAVINGKPMDTILSAIFVFKI